MTSKILNIVLALLVLFLVYKGSVNKNEKQHKISKIALQKGLIPDSLEQKVSLGKKNLLFPKPAVVIGSYDKDGIPNIMTAAWSGVVNSHPLKIAVSMRPATLSYHNLTLNKAFTINIASTDWVGVVDYVGRHSGHNIQKFQKLGLTPIKADSVYAPYIKEFPIAIECKITEIIDLGSHRQFIGQVMDTKVSKAFLKGKNNIDIEKLNPLILANGYYGLGEYIAKPGEASKIYEK